MVQAKTAELNVVRREVLGKRVKRLRREGVTPANIYGHHLDSLAVQVSSDELKHVLREAGRNDIVYVRLDGDEPRPTFVKDVQRNPVTDAILHVDFLQISLKEKARMEVPIHLVGTPPAVTILGGILMHGVDHVTVEGLPMDIPSVLEVDVSGLENIDQSLHVSDLTAVEGVTILADPELVIAKVAPPAVERVEEEEAAEEEEGAEEEGAEGPAAEAEPAESSE